MRILLVAVVLVAACGNSSSKQNADMSMTSEDLAMASNDMAAPHDLSVMATKLLFPSPLPSPTSDTRLPDILVDVADASGQTVAQPSVMVTLTLGGGSGGQLVGVTTVATTAGRATFSDLYLDRPGSYSLTAASGTLASAQQLFTATAAWTQPGVSPSPSPQPSMFWSAVIAPDNPSVIYFSTDTGLFKSSDGGSSWQLQLPGGVTAALGQVAADPQNRIYVRGSGGFYRQASGDSSWTALGWTGRTLAFTSNEIYALTGSNTFQWSNNDGSTWTPVSTAPAIPPDGDQLLVDPTTSGASAVLYLSGQMSTQPISEVMYASTDRGQTWNSIDPCTSSVLGNNFVGVDGTAFVACQGALYRSTDHGAHFAAVTFSYPFADNLMAMATSPSNHAVVYGFAIRGGMFRSSDSGQSFVEVGFYSPNLVTNSAFAVDPGSADTVWAGIAGRGLFRTVTGGLH